MNILENNTQRKFVGRAIKYFQNYLRQSNIENPNLLNNNEKVSIYAKLKYGVVLENLTKKECSRYIIDEYKKTLNKTRGYNNQSYVKKGVPIINEKAKNIKTLHEEMLNKIDIFNKKINKIRYREFLKTEYWEYVRMLKLKQQPKCKCGADRLLQVHHKTYEHHYNEHEHLEDLVVMCDICHKKEHKK
jgi:hypothetical protein